MLNFYWPVGFKPRLLWIKLALIEVQAFTPHKKSETATKMINWKALDNVPLLFYILALKTLLLCLGFAGVKIYQSRKEDEALKKQQAERRRLAQQSQELLDNLKED
uniref:Small integral membrane protein 11A n=2 Tax=Cyprinodon variegatus TaxID=28743 RepID=A0A3Q2E0Y4_CYPVA